MRRALALAVVGVTCAAAWATPHEARQAPHRTASVRADLPDAWPCDDDTCLNPVTWTSVTRELSDALAEGDTPDAVRRDWTVCWTASGHVTFVVCPDGTVETS